MSNRLENDWLNESQEKSDYEGIADVEWRGYSYEFDLTRVYMQSSTGNLFYAEDSGCSCPSPFEDKTTDDLTPITRLQDWYDHVATRTVKANPDEYGYQYPEPTPTSAIDQAEVARKVIEQKLSEVNA